MFHCIREINYIVHRTYREWAWSSSRHRCNADEDDDGGAESRLLAHRCILQRDGVRRRCGGVLQRDALHDALLRDPLRDPLRDQASYLFQ